MSISNVTGFSIPDYLPDFNDFFSNESDNSYSLVENVASWFMPAPIATAIGVFGAVRSFQTNRVTSQGEPTTSPALLGGLALLGSLALPFILGRVSWTNSPVVQALESTLVRGGWASRLTRGIAEKVKGSLAQKAPRLVVTGQGPDMAALLVRHRFWNDGFSFFAHLNQDHILFTHGNCEKVSSKNAGRLLSALANHLADNDRIDANDVVFGLSNCGNYLTLGLREGSSFRLRHLWDALVYE